MTSSVGAEAISPADCHQGYVEYYDPITDNEDYDDLEILELRSELGGEEDDDEQIERIKMKEAEESLLNLTSDELSETTYCESTWASDRDRETGCTKECRNRTNWYQDEIEKMEKCWMEARALMAIEIEEWQKDEELTGYKCNEWEKQREDLLEQIARHMEQKEFEKSQVQRKNSEIINLKDKLNQTQNKAAESEKSQKKVEDHLSEIIANLKKALDKISILESEKTSLQTKIDQQKKMFDKRGIELDNQLKEANKHSEDRLKTIEDKQMENELLKKKYEKIMEEYHEDRNKNAKTEILLRQTRKEMEEYRKDLKEKYALISVLKINLTEKEGAISRGKKRVFKLANELKQQNSKKEKLALFKNSQEIQLACKKKLEEEKKRYEQLEAERAEEMADYRTDIAIKKVEIKRKKQQLDAAINGAGSHEFSQQDEIKGLRKKNATLIKDCHRYSSAVKVLHRSLKAAEEGAREREAEYVRQSNAHNQQSNGQLDGVCINNNKTRVGRAAMKRTFKQEPMTAETGNGDEERPQLSLRHSHISPSKQKRHFS